MAYSRWDPAHMLDLHTTGKSGTPPTCSSLIFFWNWRPSVCSSSILLCNWLYSKSFLGREMQNGWRQSSQRLRRLKSMTLGHTSWAFHPAAACHSPDLIWTLGRASDLPQVSFCSFPDQHGASFLALGNFQAEKGTKILFENKCFALEDPWGALPTLKF